MKTGRVVQSCTLALKNRANVCETLRHRRYLSVRRRRLRCGRTRCFTNRTQSSKRVEVRVSHVQFWPAALYAARIKFQRIFPSPIVRSSHEKEKKKKKSTFLATDEFQILLSNILHLQYSYNFIVIQLIKGVYAQNFMKNINLFFKKLLESY